MPKIPQHGFARSQGARVSAPLQGPGLLATVTDALLGLAKERDEMRQRNELSEAITEAELRISRGVQELKKNPDPDNHAANVSELIQSVTGEILGGVQLGPENQAELTNTFRKLSLEYEVQGNVAQAAMVVDRGRASVLRTTRTYEDMITEAETPADRIRLVREFEGVMARAVQDGYYKDEEATNSLLTVLDRATLRRAELIAFGDPEAILRSDDLEEDYGIRPHQQDDIIGKALTALKNRDNRIDRDLAAKKQELESDLLVAGVKGELTPKMIREASPFVSREAAMWATRQLTDPTAVPLDPILLRDARAGVLDGTVSAAGAKQLLYDDSLPGKEGVALFRQALQTQDAGFQRAKQLLYGAAGLRDIMTMMDETDKQLKALILERLAKARTKGEDPDEVAKTYLPVIKALRDGDFKSERGMIEGKLSSHPFPDVRSMPRGPEKLRLMVLWNRLNELQKEEERLGTAIRK